jgi:hypothetical protein
VEAFEHQPTPTDLLGYSLDEEDQIAPAGVQSTRPSDTLSDGPLIIPMIIQTILLYPSGAIWTDTAPNVSRPDPSGALQTDAEHPTRNRKVVGSNPTSGSTSSQLRGPI